MWWYHWFCWLLSASGVICILIAHEHYSIDVLIGYIATTRIFWWYHTMANTHVGTHIIILLVNSTFSDESIDCLIPFISSFNFGVYFCSGAASGFQQLPVEGMVELDLQFPGAERSDHGSHRVLVAGGPAFLLQTEVQDRGGGEGRVRNPAH